MNNNTRHPPVGAIEVLPAEPMAWRVKYLGHNEYSVELRESSTGVLMFGPFTVRAISPQRAVIAAQWRDTLKKLD